MANAPKVWSKDEVQQMWPQALDELRGFQRALENRAGLTAVQLDMALQLADAEFRRLKQFPRYHLKVDGNDQWFDRNMVGAAYDNSYAKVEMGAWVQDGPDDAPRPMTAGEKRMIVDDADSYSASK